MDRNTPVTVLQKNKPSFSRIRERISIDGVSPLPQQRTRTPSITKHTITVPVPARKVLAQREMADNPLIVRARAHVKERSVALIPTSSAPKYSILQQTLQEFPTKIQISTARRVLYGVWSLLRYRQKQRFLLASLSIFGLVLFSGWMLSDNNSQNSTQDIRSKVASWTTPHIVSAPVTNEQIMAHVTASPVQPQRISIPTANVVARVIPSSGLMSIINSNDVLWVKRSVLPGSSGTSVYIAYNTQHSFLGVTQVKIGDNIEIMRGNGDVLRYMIRESVETNDPINIETIIQKKEMNSEIIFIVLDKTEQRIDTIGKKLVVSAALR